MASIDTLAALATRQELEGWKLPSQYAGLCEAIEAAVNERPIPPTEFLSDVVQLLQTLVNEMVKKDAELSPLLWIWTMGCGGCLALRRYTVVPERVNVRPKHKDVVHRLSPILSITAHASSTLEVDLCHYNLNAVVAESLQMTVLANLPGEFMLHHRDGMPVEQWRQLRTAISLKTGVRRLLQLGPTTAGKFDMYFLVSWVDTQSNFWQWSEQQGNYVLHDDGRYVTRLTVFDERHSPEFSRWHKLS